MKKQIGALLACALFPCSTFALYQADNPGIIFNKNYALTIVLKDSGQTILNEQVKNVRSGSSVVCEVNAQQPGTGKTVKTNIFYSLADNKLTTVAETISSSNEGTPLQYIKINFDWNKMTANYSAQDFASGKTTNRTIKLTPKSMLARSSSIYFQNLLAAKKSSDTFSLITPTGDSYSMTANISYAPQTITVKEKNYSCYKVTMKPNMGMLAMVLPEMNFYFETDPPYEFVRYQGPQEGPTSPNIIQEVTN